MFLKKPKKYTLCIENAIQDITELEDGVFSEKMVGDGFFYKSEEDILTIRAFAKCKVNMMFPTKHALGLTLDGIDIMIHYGLDTVTENGKGIKCNLKQGQTVNKGDTLLVIDQKYYVENNYQTPVIYVFPNLEELKYKFEIIDMQAGEIELLM